MHYCDINSRDVQGVTLADLLVNIEADFEMIDGHKVIHRAAFQDVDRDERVLRSPGLLDGEQGDQHRRGRDRAEC
ncbi:hypothetical protein GCM10023196_033090 [Actinoallomurus vinaceus]|uniref:Uncharacterized protein n=1 Tax=Actinoallomurus vinaceus TaxID=1080074 RepID=A0ABP8U9M7_9ACTN